MGAMNTDYLLKVLNSHRVEYLLIGGVNFLLRHAPVLTYDVDFWINDTRENRRLCEAALDELQAEWGATEEAWGPVSRLSPDWLGGQGVVCLTSPHAAIDIFRSVKGLGNWADSRATAHEGTTASGVTYLGLSDEDMLACQMALPEGQRKQQRVDELNKALER